MKKLMMTLIAMLTLTVSANAMSFEQARNEALFLTDKMAYELNLTDEQYEAAYEINLDYLMGVTGRADVFGTYWERRNLDLSYILLDWQWEAYLAATYFYRPLYWDAGYWHFGIYARYPHRDYFYFGRPHFYATYRGGHAWHVNGGRSFYVGRRDHFRSPRASHFGMHDRWNRGDFRGSHHSSTHITGPNHRERIGGTTNGRIGSNRSERMGTSRSERIGSNRSGRTFDGSRSNDMYNRSQRSGSSMHNMPSRNFNGSNRSSLGSDRSSMRSDRSSMSGNRSSMPSRSFGSSSSPSRSYGSTASPSRSFGGSHSSAPTRSFGGGSHSNSGSHSGSMHSGGSHGGGSSHGGGHFGSRR